MARMDTSILSSDEWASAATNDLEAKHLTRLSADSRRWLGYRYNILGGRLGRNSGAQLASVETHLLLCGP
jgi:hypothetical protein